MTLRLDNIRQVSERNMELLQTFCEVTLEPAFVIVRAPSIETQDEQLPPPVLDLSRRKENAQILLALGKPPHEVAKLTGFSPDEVKSFKAATERGA